MQQPVISSGIEYEKELTRIFKRFNKHFWNNELPDVVITFTPTKKKHGHLSVNKVWTSKSTKESKYELNISALDIDRPAEELCATLLHEQVHLYCRVHNLKETTDEHRFHNKVFKKVAEDHGLIVSHAPRIGWSKTVLDESAKKYLKKLNVKQFDLHRIVSHQPGTRPLLRYQCEGCGESVAWLSKDQALICGICGFPLSYHPSERD